MFYLLTYYHRKEKLNEKYKPSLETLAISVALLLSLSKYLQTIYTKLQLVQLLPTKSCTKILHFTALARKVYDYHIQMNVINFEIIY
jgi:hypothetical protein